MANITTDGITFDLLGNTMQVGDTIAAAFRQGNEGVLEVGTITGFSTRMLHGNRVQTILVHWDRIGHGGGVDDRDQDSWIYDHIKRFVKIG